MKGESCGDNNMSVESEDGKDLVHVLLEIQKQNKAGSSIDRDSIKGLSAVSPQSFITEAQRKHKIMKC
ncbi:PREDICTED: cytochrome P450 [Prunus dulcis]|uniref:PREDICTED: cytochrome P450 n=1 Tax=Prunus dulcis TaxID=3755 RepID=A0A5E4FJQ1_PRUDU|nr:PREDICTED: cytochrome P450 [Prunus dulcis]